MITADLIGQLGALPTAALSDALDTIGFAGQCLGIAPLTPGSRLVGRAYTLRYRPVDVTAGTVGDYIDDVPSGQVCVLDNGGRLDCTVWGDILTTVASGRGVAGTVIDGVSRDVAHCRELGYPIFTRGRFMRTGKDRVQLEAVQVPVVIGCVSVRPGDILVGDDDGIVVIPTEIEERVLERALQTEAAEKRIMAAVQSGRSLREARIAHNYHGLQRREQ